MRLPPIRQLQYLVALQEHLHFGNAAKHLNVTQSTLSTGIRELEKFLGVTLVERTNKSVSFTRPGEQIADRSRYVIMQTEDLVDGARVFSDPLALPVKLGAIPTIAPYIVGRYARELRDRHPRIQLYIRENTTANLIRELLDNKLDIALLALPYDTGLVDTRVVYREGFHLGYHRESEIISTGKVDFEEIPDESLLLLEDGHCLRDHALSGCRLKNQKKIHTFGANSLQMLVQMVDNDLGITLLPDMALDAGILEGTNIETRKLPARQFYRDIGFAWRKGNYRMQLLEDLMTRLSSPV
jgi:LysR family transcriptional regulator, hydrogen peroxide-inducible genes activator